MPANACLPITAYRPLTVPVLQTQHNEHKQRYHYRNPEREMNHYVRPGRKEVKLAFPPNLMKFLTLKEPVAQIQTQGNVWLYGL